MYKTNQKCVICNKGKLSKKIIKEDFKYKNKHLTIDNYAVFECNNCKEALVDPSTIRSTERVLTDFRRETDGFLTSGDIVAIRKKLGKTQEKMAEILGIGKKNFARYENGTVTQSKAMDNLLRVLDNHPESLNVFKPGLYPETKKDISTTLFSTSDETTQSFVSFVTTQSFVATSTNYLANVLESETNTEGISLKGTDFSAPKPIEEEAKAA